MIADRTVTATFSKIMPTLTVNVTGSGTVGRSPPGINCVGPATCSYDFAPGTSVTLTATPAEGWFFAGWAGECTGIELCDVNMTEFRTVQAMFKYGPTDYFLFDTARTSTGHLGETGGRAGADAICAVDEDRPRDVAGNLICTYYWAFISVDEDDEIRDFPTIIPARSGFAWNPEANWYFRDGEHEGVLTDSNFANLIDGIVSHRPTLGGLDHVYWTGSSADGSFKVSRCGGFDTGAGTVFGWHGNQLQYIKER